MRILRVLIFVLLPLSAFGQSNQSRAELEKSRQSILESIRATQEQLELTKKDKNASMAQLRALQNKLAQRQRLINHINQEIEYISNSIQLSSKEISQLKSNLEVLRIRYAQSIRYAYKNRSAYNMLAFLFSANDFNEAVRRLKYLKKYRDYRKEQANQIRLTQANIEKKINKLNEERQQKDMLRSTEEQQKMVIVKETTEQDKVVQELKGREKELAAAIVKNQRSLKQLERTIQSLIQREIELAKKREEEERRKLAEEQRRASTGGILVGSGSRTAEPATGSATAGATPAASSEPKPAERKSNATATSAPTARPSYSLSLTPEVAALSNNFESNKGKLPWPVEKGFIAERFGRTKHPVYNIMLENSGVEIQTSPNAPARAVFNGTVKSILVVPGMGQCVLVDHGRFFTVYSRLGNVTVKKGQEVAMKQTLGYVIANENGEYLMHFELWRVGANDKSSAQDPAQWIAH